MRFTSQSCRLSSISGPRLPRKGPRLLQLTLLLLVSARQAILVCFLVALLSFTRTGKQQFMIRLLQTLQVDDSKKVEDSLTLKQLIHQNWDYFLGLYLIYVLTLSIFPGFLYENTGTHKLGDWYISLTSILSIIRNQH